LQNDVFQWCLQHAQLDDVNVPVRVAAPREPAWSCTRRVLTTQRREPRHPTICDLSENEPIELFLRQQQANDLLNECRRA